MKLPQMDNLVLSNHDDGTPPSTPPPSKNIVPQTPPNHSTSSFALPTKGQTTMSQSKSQATSGRLSAGSGSQMTSMNYLRVKGAGSKRGSASDSESVTSHTTTPRSSFQTESTILTPRSSFQHPDSPQMSSKAGVVVTSSRTSTRRSSTASAASGKHFKI